MYVMTYIILTLLDNKMHLTTLKYDSMVVNKKTFI